MKLRRIASIIANTKPTFEAKGVSARFARFLTDKNNPDHIIVAHILQSFATEFDQWLVQSGKSPTDLRPRFTTLPKEVRSKQDLAHPKERHFFFNKEGFAVYVCMEWKCENYYNDNGGCSSPKCTIFTVNNIPISLDLAEGLVRSYKELRDKHIAAENAAKEARAAMEANEKKWDIVENVLGMKRTADGLLVAATPAE